jgi:hypothetical protein
MLKEGELKNENARKKWAERQYRDVARAVGAMEGSLGHDVGEFVRKANSAAVVYQNIRLLPLALALALFSSFVDPLGIIARGGEMRLCAAGYNIRWLLRAIVRLGLKGLFAPLSALLATLAAALTTAQRARKTGVDRSALAVA